MQRFNCFTQIHKGLRALLFDTALCLQQADFTCEEEAEEALNKVREAVLLFDEHAHKEDQFLLPMIADFEPSVLDCFEKEHATDLALSNQLTASVETFFLLTNNEEKKATGQQLCTAFVEFTSFNLQHMAKEEDLINKILWRFFSDEALMNAQQQIIQSTPPWLMDFYAKWMLRGISTPEAIQWLQAVQKTAPDVVFQTLYNKAEKELSAKQFQTVAAALTEGVLAA
ncbi:MAG: hypothetical protein JWP88_1239 [Flaviaesturariibacter sp.]|nr:hypothetical protein [Flaviaesturariibacter sp.]